MSSKASKLPATDIATQRAIGVFDSGIGGLSVLQALRAEMPQERFIYWSDSAFAPYGERSDAFLIDRCQFITAQLMAKGHVKSVVVACNTATAVAIESLRSTFPELPFIGVEPALKPALSLTQTGRVGVIGTHSTLQSARFEKLLTNVQSDASDKDVQFVVQPCRGLALAIEQQTEKATADHQEVERLCALYLREMGSFGTLPGQMDTLVLGCTHYVFAQDILQKIVGPDVQIISTGQAVAKQTQRLSSNPHAATNAAPLLATDAMQLWTTGSLEALAHAANRWLNLQPSNCHFIAPTEA